MGGTGETVTWQLWAASEALRGLGAGDVTPGEGHGEVERGVGALVRLGGLREADASRRVEPPSRFPVHHSPRDLASYSSH